MALDMTARNADAVAQLVASIEAVSNEIARQRARMRSTWQTQTQAVERVQAQIRAVDFSLDRRKTALDEVVKNFGHHPESQREYGGIPSTSIKGWLQGNGNSTWAIKPEIERQFETDHGNARQRFIESRSKTFGGAARRAGIEALSRYNARLTRLTDVRGLLETELRQVMNARSEAAANARAMADSALAPAAALALQAAERLPAPLQPWGNNIWSGWSSVDPTEGVSALFAGTLVPVSDVDLGENSNFGADTWIPLFVSLRQNLQLVYNNSSRAEALAFARSLMLRQLASAFPGELNFSFYDPVGLGQSVGELLDLAEYDPKLIGGQVWSSPQALAARLADHTSHIELVTQKYLRSTYDNIDDFNRAAGEIAEPYRLLVLFDFPTGFSEETMARLKSIALNGPRCGVHTFVLLNSGVTPPFGVDLNLIAPDLRQINLDTNFVKEHKAYSLQIRLRPEIDSPAMAAQAKVIVDGIGRTAIGRTESAVSFRKVMELFAAVAKRGIRTELSQTAGATQVDDSATWWHERSTRGVFAPIGQKGARDAAILGFDSGDHAGALLVGRPGSGKSTLLHTYIGGLATLYGPDELELYLIDFKEGVEFKSYATERLPHARVVAIESDREFGVSVLQSLRDELSRRGELLRSTGGQQAGIAEFRQATGQLLSRIVLIFDEFQVLFARNDKIGLAAADLLETIIRQGRGFGIHVLLGSQSLSGLDALGAHVPQLLPTRILLPATELDGRRVLGDDNDAGRYLTTHGEGILNRLGGAVEGNERFKGALLPEQDRIERIRALREKADRMGFSRYPTVFEGNASVPLESIKPSLFREELAASGTAGIRLRVGASMTVAGLADIELKREAGANVLAIVRDGEATNGVGISPNAGPAYGLLTAAIASAAQSQATIDVIDFMSIDDGLDQVLEPFLDLRRITLRRRRAVAPLVTSLAAEVQDRLEQDDASRPARLAFLFGVHRARELDAEFGSLDADAELTEALERIMRDGPEVGVHIWLWADSVNGASRRLTPRMLRECSWRIAGKMSSDDSLSFIGSEQGGDIRDRQLILSNDDRGVTTRAMSFSIPARTWLVDVLEPPGLSHDPQEA
jgi:S-DNA-T family DNA segregation ATPase FtsK/SpoIIIE